MAELRKATWEHNLLVIKGQHNLEPKRGWDLLQQLDPDSEKRDNTTFARAFYPNDAIVVSLKRNKLPVLKSLAEY